MLRNHLCRLISGMALSASVTADPMIPSLAKTFLDACSSLNTGGLSADGEGRSK
jgi:hypothetical protein